MGGFECGPEGFVHWNGIRIFAGMAFIASKLKIKQTAFAFLTLAGLFIPITILSASYYRIFGEYLSLNGGAGASGVSWRITLLSHLF